MKKEDGLISSSEACVGGVLVVSFAGMLCDNIGAGVAFMVILSVFLVFFIPFKLGKLKQKSILYKMLTFACINKPRTFSVCDLPGMIVSDILGAVILLFGITVLPILSWKYINLKTWDIMGIPILSDIYIGQTDWRVRPWMVYIFGGICWVIWEGAKWLLSINISQIIPAEEYLFFSGIVSMIVAGVIIVTSFVYFLVEFKIHKKIWDGLKNKTEEFCKDREIPEE